MRVQLALLAPLRSTACAHAAPWQGPASLPAPDRVALGAPETTELKLKPLTIDLLLPPHADPLAGDGAGLRPPSEGPNLAARRGAWQKELVSTVFDNARRDASSDEPPIETPKKLPRQTARRH